LLLKEPTGRALRQGNAILMVTMVWLDGNGRKWILIRLPPKIWVASALLEL
jgi:hypothetical protein